MDFSGFDIFKAGLTVIAIIRLLEFLTEVYDDVVLASYHLHLLVFVVCLIFGVIVLEDSNFIPVFSQKIRFYLRDELV